MIELTNICKSYHGHVALHEVNLSIQSGEIFGIIGKSGAGKSTLLRCMNVLERPDRGQVHINGQNMLTLSPRELRQARHNVAMIFQHFNLLHSQNVRQNIALPMHIQGLDKTTINTKVDELLDVVELSHKQHAHPSKLSGGQKQRVAIARALSCNAQVLLCDEATSALDRETTDSILDLIQKINRLYHLTVVLITHDMHVIKTICQRVAIMEHGQLLETMTLADALSHQTSLTRQLLFKELCPKLPHGLTLVTTPNHRPLLRLLFEGEHAAGPFISQASRELNLDIRILLANIDHIQSITCGVLVIELNAQPDVLQAFITRCTHHGLTVEILGYAVIPHA